MKKKKVWNEIQILRGMGRIKENIECVANQTEWII